MSAVAAAKFEFDTAAWNIQFVMNHQDFLRLDFVKLSQSGNSLTGAVHKSHGFEQPNITIRRNGACYFAVKFLLVFKIDFPFPCQFVQQPKADIVARLFVFLAWIAQTDD